jgi:hypothetical protein
MWPASVSAGRLKLWLCAPSPQIIGAWPNAAPKKRFCSDIGTRYCAGGIAVQEVKGRALQEHGLETRDHYNNYMLLVVRQLSGALVGKT